MSTTITITAPPSSSSAYPYPPFPHLSQSTPLPSSLSHSHSHSPYPAHPAHSMHLIHTGQPGAPQGPITPTTRTQRLKAKLTQLLGKDAPRYWQAVTQFLTGKIMRQEMDSVLSGLLGSVEALALHNAFLLSILRTASLSPTALAALSLPPPGALQPSKKRKRLYPYQGPGEDEDEEAYGGRSKRMREWIVGMGRAERERLKGLAAASRGGEGDGEEYKASEVGAERGVRYIPGTAYTSHSLPSTLLSTHTRTLPAAQVLQQRLASIALSRGLTGGVSPDCVPLLTAALESHLKGVVARGLSLTQGGLSFASIKTAPHRPTAPGTSTAAPPALAATGAGGDLKPQPKPTREEHLPLDTTDLRTLLTIAPSSIPAKTASTVQLAWQPVPPSSIPNPTLPGLGQLSGAGAGGKTGREGTGASAGGREGREGREGKESRESREAREAQKQVERLLALRSGIREEVLRVLEGREGGKGDVFAPGSSSGVVSGAAGLGGGLGGSAVGGGGGGGGGEEEGKRRWEEVDRVGEWIAAVV